MRVLIISRIDEALRRSVAASKFRMRKFSFG